MISLDGWRSALARYCEHGNSDAGGCEGGRGYGPCAPGEFVYCAHGVDVRMVTKDGSPCCAWCRGVSRRQANRSTYYPPRSSQ
jgi:hypothetical protein